MRFGGLYITLVWYFCTGIIQGKSSEGDGLTQEKGIQPNFGLRNGLSIEESYFKETLDKNGGSMTCVDFFIARGVIKKEEVEEIDIIEEIKSFQEGMELEPSGDCNSLTMKALQDLTMSEVEDAHQKLAKRRVKRQATTTTSAVTTATGTTTTGPTTTAAPTTPDPAQERMVVSLITAAVVVVFATIAGILACVVTIRSADSAAAAGMPKMPRQFVYQQRPASNLNYVMSA